MREFDFKVHHRHGLHARPAAHVVAMTSEFDSRVRVIYNNQEVDGKSILGLLSLAAPHGACVRVKVDGPDERQVQARLLALFDHTNQEFIPSDTNE
ncbi:MAG: HPr family phosphocarrier protein [Gammaproteobacteria bacterium]|nr:HPr family phosphocarrier protein [Gammaproteobacteria bacterium]NND59585.1 HPr family phosphocarrier protein [Gammaproteobacteria bacterium]